MLVSRIRPRLHLQPVTSKMAREIDETISKKVTSALGVRNTTSALLSLPIRLHGCGFPSIQVINAEIATTMLLRGLNHHLPEVSKMAHITMANWQCTANGCVPPLERLARSTDKRTTVPCIPDAWKAAAEYLNASQLPIVETDQNHLFQSPIEHLTRRVTKQTGNTIPLRSVNRLRAAQTAETSFKPVAEWLTEGQKLANDSGNRGLIASVNEVSKWLETYPFKDKLKIWDPSVFVSRATRRNHYNNLLSSAFHINDSNGTNL